MATPRSHYGLDATNFFVAAMQSAFGVFVTIHLVRNQWEPRAIGFALAVSTVISLVSQAPAGAFIDSMQDKRRVVRLGAVGVGIAALLLALSSAKPAVYVAQALQGLASSLIGPGIAAISLASVGHAAFGERIGRNARFASIGNGLTAGVMGLLGSYFEPGAIFWLAAALTLPTLLSLSLVGLEDFDMSAADAAGRDGEADEDKTVSWEGLKSLFLDRRLLIFAVCIMLFFASSAALLPVAAGRVTRERPELATFIVAVTMLLPQAIVATISPWIGRSAERVGRRPILLLGWGLVPLQAALCAVLPGPYALVMFQGLSGVSGAVFGVMMPVVTNDLTRGTRRFNLTLGALGVAISLGASLSTFFTGAVISAYGDLLAFVCLALTGLLGLLLLFAMPETLPSTGAAPSAKGHRRPIDVV